MLEVAAFAFKEQMPVLTKVSINRSAQGNGGLRLLWYPTEADAAAEAASLAAGMSLKHRAFNTGFSGCARHEFTDASRLRAASTDPFTDPVASVLLSHCWLSGYRNDGYIVAARRDQRYQTSFQSSS